MREGRDDTAITKACTHVSLKSASKMLPSLETDQSSNCWFGLETLPEAPGCSAPGCDRDSLQCSRRDNASLEGTRHPDGHQGLCYIQQGSEVEECPCGQGQENHSRFLLGESGL